MLSRLGAPGEERRVLGADDPLAPQILVGLVGVLLEQVHQATPIRRTENAFGLGCVGVPPAPLVPAVAPSVPAGGW